MTGRSTGGRRPGRPQPGRPGRSACPRASARPEADAPVSPVALPAGARRRRPTRTCTARHRDGCDGGPPTLPVGSRRYDRGVVLSPDPMAALDALIAAAASGDLERIARRHDLRLLGVFGSAFRRWHDPDMPAPRDLDVAVSFAGPPRLLALLDDLVTLTGYDGIDLLVLDDADPVARAEGFVGLGLYEREPGAWAIGQMAALAERRDTEHLRRLDLEALRGP